MATVSPHRPFLMDSPASCKSCCLCEGASVGGILFKDICAIAYHPVMRSGGVAGIAQINGLRLETEPARHMQQAVHRVASAGVTVIDILGPQLLDRLRGRAIQFLRGFIVVIVTQVRADDD